MPLDRRSLRIIAFRGLTLTFTLFVIVLLTSVIMGATGYDETVLKSLINEEIRAFRQELSRPGSPYTPEEREKLVREQEARLRQIYGLDKPWYERTVSYLPKLVTLDLYVTSDDVAGVLGLRRPLKVGEAIAVALPRTIIMITLAYALSALIAIPMGPYIAYKRGSLLDKGVIAYAAITNAFPVWWLAMLSIFFFGFYLNVAPTTYRPVIAHITSLSESLSSLDVASALSALIRIAYFSYVPIIVVTFSTLGSWLYSARAVAIRVVSEDYVAAARARGLSESTVVRRYVLRVIAGSVLTFIILGLAGSISGYIITESVFDWPGMGLLTYVSISVGDSQMVLAIVYVTTLVYVAARFLLEVLYVILDPRVKL
ncbi:MAG: ABC transporter permease [Acidilobaceae archaeon]|nr:ABC transporter permease [Acidilobaceae archaeon]MDW7974311.1 ABC transporter permease [Sulfolobales archaeon]